MNSIRVVDRASRDEKIESILADAWAIAEDKPNGRWRGDVLRMAYELITLLDGDCDLRRKMRRIDKCAIKAQKAKPPTVFCVETGHGFHGRRAAAKWVASETGISCSLSGIQRSVETGQTVHGYHFIQIGRPVPNFPRSRARTVCDILSGFVYEGVKDAAEAVGWTHRRVDFDMSRKNPKRFVDV